MKVTWTNTARETLHRHLARSAPALGAAGADPAEVAADLERHIEEELATSQLGVVTERDVSTVLGRLAPGMIVEAPRAGEGGGRGDGMPMGGQSPGAEGGGGGVGGRGVGLSPGTLANLTIFGVALPLVAWGVEAVWGACAGLFFDPFPSWLHVMAGLLVVISNAVVLGCRGRAGPGMAGALWALNAAGCGVAAYYSILMAPLMPMAVPGVLFLVGLLPLAPLGALMCGLRLRVMLGARVPSGAARIAGWWLPGSTAFVMLMTPLVLSVSTLAWAREYGDTESGERRAALVERLRWLGSKATLLEACYGTDRWSWTAWTAPRVSPELARELYFRVTGDPFNAVRAPAGMRGRRGRGLVGGMESETGGANWDEALGGESVSGRVAGLSMVSSRLDGFCNPGPATAFVEWTMEFRNDDPASPREARAEVLLPPGGVVSRLTLWVNGEEREAAFAARGAVRAAYQKVAVEQRRDPVLVTTSGPDRVLVQCFPVPASGGVLRIRLGITSPLLIGAEGGDRVTMSWPMIVERNFGLGADFRHHCFLDSGQPFEAGEGWTVDETGQGRFGWRAAMTSGELMDPRRVVRMRRDGTVVRTEAMDGRTDGGGRVIQELVQRPAVRARRLALVLDGSARMGEAAAELVRAMRQAGDLPETRLFVAGDRIREMNLGRGTAVGVEAGRVLEGFVGAGGQDPTGALLKALDWAAAEGGGVVAWIHGGLPVKFPGIEALRQRLEWRPDPARVRVVDVASRPGPDRLGGAMDGLAAWERRPRLGSLEADLAGLLFELSGVGGRWEPVRRWEAGRSGGGDDARGSHLVRLWAAGEVRRLLEANERDAAIRVASVHQLVTRVTGAVVLETAQQYREAGLTPVDPGTVPMVPEPGTWVLMVLGTGMLGWWHGQRGGGGQRSSRTR